MTRQIWKYQITPPSSAEGDVKIIMPIGSKILTIQTQYGNPYMWVLIDTTEERKVERVFRIYGTGHSIDEGNRNYIGTFQVEDESLVFHVFEELTNNPN